MEFEPVLSRTRSLARTRRVLSRSIDTMEPRRLLAGYVPLAPIANPLWTTGYFTPTGTVDLQTDAALSSDIPAGEAASLPRRQDCRQRPTAP
ncbi:MAG: hypothetical protein QM770_14580 [Tepidisphaeraceae bacterium]